MAALVSTSPRPLAIDKRGRAFQVPDSACAWLVLENTGGRPRNIEDEGGNPTTIPIDADIDDLAQVVGDETELILVPLDDDNKKLPMRAHISLTPTALGGWQSARPSGEMDSAIVMATLQHMFSLNNRLIAVTESNAMVFHNATKTLADAITELQRGSVGMLETANTTIKVANGVEALEREEPPEVDVANLAEQLEDTVFASIKNKANQPAWVPFATMAFQGLTSLAKTYLASEQGKADAAKFAQATASAKPTAPAVKSQVAEPDAEREQVEPEAKPKESEAKREEAEAKREEAKAQREEPKAPATTTEAGCCTPPPWFSTSTASAPAPVSLAMYCQEPTHKDDPDAPAPSTQ